MAPAATLEVADIFRSYGGRFREQRAGRLPLEHLRAMSAIERCRTAELGGHVYECDHCHERRVAYNSCRNRHCPKCQGAERLRWLEARQRDLLPVDYFHVVFTLPAEIGPLALRNPKALYGLLFRCAAQTLLEVATSPKHLGARLGVLAVLHTWGQQLTHHPHVHCIVPGGGLSSTRGRWIPSRRGYLLPVQVLSRVFRGKYLAGLGAAKAAGELALVGKLERLADPESFRGLLDGLYSQEWVVYCKPPFAGPETVLKYLSRYTHRVALSNQRLLRMEGDTVVLTYKDYRHGGRQRLLRLPAPELIRRFLQHVLPCGFVRIRYYGLLANRHRADALKLCREALGAPQAEEEPSEDALPSWTCPLCGEGTLKIVEWIGGPEDAATLTRERAPPCRAA